MLLLVFCVISGFFSAILPFLLRSVFIQRVGGLTACSVGRSHAINLFTGAGATYPVQRGLVAEHTQTLLDGHVTENPPEQRENESRDLRRLSSRRDRTEIPTRGLVNSGDDT